MKYTFKCSKCNHEFEAELIMAEGSNEVISLNPCECPECGCTKLTGRFTIDSKNWIGIYGTNG